MNRTEVEQVIRFVCWRMKVRPPKIRTMKANGHREHYHPDTRTIDLRAETEEYVVLHEAAHHVVEARKPRLNRAERHLINRAWNKAKRLVPAKQRNWTAFDERGRAHVGMRWQYEDGISHGPAFVSALTDILAVWPMVYPWQHEYRCVQSEAIRLGLYERPAKKA